MLKRLLKSLKREEINPIATQVPVTASAVTISRDEHTISRKQISKNALNVMYELTRAGYQAYLVGGGVRDLQLGLSPKDFDVATDATPEQVQEFLDLGVDVNERKGESGMTPLLWASRNNPNVEVVRLLLKSGSDVSMNSHSGGCVSRNSASRIKLSESSIGTVVM